MRGGYGDLRPNGGAAPLQKMGWHCVYNGNTTDIIDLHIFVDTCAHQVFTNPNSTNHQRNSISLNKAHPLHNHFFLLLDYNPRNIR